MSAITTPTIRTAILAILAALVVCCTLQARAALASSDQEAIFQDDPQLLSNPPGTLATLSLLGVDRVRVTVRWSSIAPVRRPAHFDAANPASYPQSAWRPYDAIVRDAQTAGIAVAFTLTGPAPRWATGPGQPKGAPPGVWKPSAAQFGAFVRAVATRYTGRYKPAGSITPLPRVSFWTVWNEPNYGVDLAPQAINHDTIEVGAAAYRRLLDAAWSALQGTGHGADTILIGETAPRGLDHPIGNFSGVKPLRFLRALYCVDSSYRQLRGAAARARACPATAAGSRAFRAAHPALFKASGFADHPYEQGFPPNQPTTSDPSRFKSDPDYADLPEIPRLEQVLDRLNRIYGSGSRFPIYSTEYGYWTNPPDPAARIGPATAAYYMNWAEYISWRQPRIRSYDQYLLVDPPRSNFASGLMLPSGAHKATFDAYRLPLYLPVTWAARGTALEVWGCARPAWSSLAPGDGPPRVAIQFRAGASGSFTTIRTVTITHPRGYFDLRQPLTTSGALRLAFTYSDGQTVYSRTVSVTVR